MLWSSLFLVICFDIVWPLGFRIVESFYIYQMVYHVGRCGNFMGYPDCQVKSVPRDEEKKAEEKMKRYLDINLQTSMLLLLTCCVSF